MARRVKSRRPAGTGPYRDCPGTSRNGNVIIKNAGPRRDKYYFVNAELRAIDTSYQSLPTCSISSSSLYYVMCTHAAADVGPSPCCRYTRIFEESKLSRRHCAHTTHLVGINQNLVYDRNDMGIRNNVIKRESRAHTHTHINIILYECNDVGVHLRLCTT